MEKLRMSGGFPLRGEVDISGAKNAAVAILPATLLADGVCRIENLPNIEDVGISLEILRTLGAYINRVNRSVVEIDTTGVASHVVHHDLARQMRGSYYFLGALLSRFGTCKVAMPGGCNFGVRPIDQHLKGFSALGASVSPMESGMIELKADRLVGNSIYLDKITVGATINIILSAVKARGITVIENAAKEPHVVDLANFLNFMGADVRGAGTDVIKIRGVEEMHGTSYSIIPDQIEAGTYMVAAAATTGDVLVRNIIPKHLESITAKLMEMGVEVTEYDDAIRVRRNGALVHCNVKTMPHPGFPTDMQPQIAVLLSLAEGTSILTEDVMDNRFRHIDELRRMGVQVSVDGKVAVFQGVEQLTAAPIRAVDLRAGAAMVIAALAASGTTEIDDIHHIERGYEDMVEKFQKLGADICRIHEPDHILRQA